MHSTVEHLELLLLIAAVVAMLVRKVCLPNQVHLPYTVGLVLTGVALSFSHVSPRIELTRDLIFTALLPPLIFEAALHIHWGALRNNLAVILVLATVGVLLSALLTAAGMRYLVGWDWAAAALFGALISATDPVSVIAMFSEAGVTGRMRLLVEAESIFNDGTAAVAFSVALAATQGPSIGGLAIAGSFLFNLLGGILCGLFVGALVLGLAGRTEDHLVELTLTTVAAYGSFLAAQHFGCSGVLASMAAGLLLGNVESLGAFSVRGRQALMGLWEYTAFVANSLIFLLLGFREAQQPFGKVLIPTLIAIAVVLVSRAVPVYLCCVPFARSAQRVPRGEQHVLVWGGLRGALALALALSLPTAVPQRDEIVTVTFGVVAFSVIVQGLTITPLMIRLGLLHPKGEPVRSPSTP